MCFKLGPKFYEYLKFRGWQQKDLAQALNYSEPFISMILSNQRGLSASFMERLIRLTSLTPNELFILSETGDRPDYQFEKRAMLKIEGKDYFHPQKDGISDGNYVS